MSRSSLEWYEQLSRGLVWAGGVVLVLAIVGAVMIAGSDNAIGIAPEAEQQGRGVVALASLGIGLAAAGLMSGVGAILRLLVTDRLEKLGPAPERATQPPRGFESRKPAEPRKPAERQARRRPRRDDSEDDPSSDDG